MGFAELQEMVKPQEDAVSTKDEVRITLRFDLRDAKEKRIYENLERVMKFVDSKRAPTVVLELLDEAAAAFVVQVIEAKTD